MSDLRRELREIAEQHCNEWINGRGPSLLPAVEAVAIEFARRFVEELAKENCVWCRECSGTLEPDGRRHSSVVGRWTRGCSFHEGWELLSSLSDPPQDEETSK